MKKFQNINPILSDTMKTHLIMNLNDFGIWKNDYELFLNKRAKIVSEESYKRIIKQKIDEKPQGDIDDDYEPKVEVVELFTRAQLILYSR